MKHYLFLAILLLLPACNISSDNFPSISGPVSYAELISKSLAEQQSIVGSLSAEERALLWSRKLDDTLASLSLTENEKNIIRPLRALICKEMFLPDTPERSLYNSLSPCIESLLTSQMGWDDKKMVVFLETIMTEKEIISTPHLSYLLPLEWELDKW